MRHHAGTVADQAGPRKAVLLGLPAAALSGVLYMASVALPLGPTVSLLVIVAGRLLMGVGEALFIVKSGTVKVTKKTAGGEQELAVLGPGEALGSLTVLAKGVRMVSAVASGRR